MTMPAGAGQDVELEGVVRMVGHDLRNNLGVMGNSVYYLNMKLGAAEPKVTRHLDILAREIALTNRAIVDLIDLVAPKKPRPALIDLSALVQGVVERNLPVHSDSPAVHVALWPERLATRGDGEQIVRAIENVLLHRYENLSDGAVLQISTKPHLGRGMVEFSDNGRACEQAELDRLVDVTTGSKQPGLHLSLVVARRLLALNGGELAMWSPANGGCRFAVTLELA